MILAQSRRLPCLTSWPAVLLILASAACGFGQETKPDTAAYARAIAQAQEDLDAGKATEARQRLQATDKSLRSFEYEYILARAQAAMNGAAPDLVRTVAF